MIKGLSAGLSDDHNIYHFSTVLHPKICEKCNKSVHHLLCEDWMIFEPTGGSMSELSLPFPGMWHHVVWWVGSSILDECATSFYSVKDICIYLSNYMYHITEPMQRDLCVFQEYVLCKNLLLHGERVMWRMNDMPEDCSLKTQDCENLDLHPINLCSGYESNCVVGLFL